VIIGLSADTPAANKAFKEKFDFPYDLLSDQDLAVSVAYGAAESTDAKRPSRISYLIDTEGRVAKVYAKVTPADHPDQVLADLG